MFRGPRNRQICYVGTLGKHNLSCGQFRLKIVIYKIPTYATALVFLLHKMYKKHNNVKFCH
jgi:hypothetical protein